jgi:hypothetical protein
MFSLIGKILYAVAKWFWPDLAQWEQECCRACRVAGTAARKLHVSMHRNEVEPRAEFESLVAGMGTMEKLMRGPSRAFLPDAWRTPSTKDTQDAR